MAISDTEASPSYPQFWLALAIGALKGNLVMGRLVRRDADDVVAEQGDTININKRGSLTVRDKAEYKGAFMSDRLYAAYGFDPAERAGGGGGGGDKGGETTQSP